MTASSEAHNTRATRRFATFVNYYGSQEACQKTRHASQSDNGPWTGIIIITDNKDIFVTTPQIKWDRGKKIIKSILEAFERSNGDVVTFDHKTMEKDCGFLVHLAMIFDWMKPFFKGIHLTLESWRGNWRADRWKYDQSEWRQLLREIALA